MLNKNISDNEYIAILIGMVIFSEIPDELKNGVVDFLIKLSGDMKNE